MVLRAVCEWSEDRHGLHPATQIGPVTSELQLQRVLGYIQTGQQEGPRYVRGARDAPTPAWLLGSSLRQPSLPMSTMR
jgi:acyl-CoA reductase-like NAD-dependent aldehyde dehydrogenase